MKRNTFSCFFLLYFIFFVNSIWAQDTLVKKNGERIIVDMMQISGDTLMFRLDNVVTKMSNDNLLRIGYANGNVTMFQTKILKKSNPQALIIPPFTNHPIEMYNELYFQNGKPLTVKEVDKIVGSQNNRNIQLKYLSLKKSQNAKVFCGSVAGITFAGALLFMALENRSGLAQSRNSRNNYFYGYGTATILLGTLAYTNFTFEKNKRKELVYLYDDTYYPAQKK